MAVLAVIGTSHVAATTYLFADADIRRFARVNPARMVWAPLGILAGGFALLSQPGLPFVLMASAFFVWQAWHFGCQNIGVASFISLSDRGRPLAVFEKRAIRVGVTVGLLGVLAAMAPGYLPVPPELAAVFELAWHVGAVLAIPMSGVAAWLTWRALQGRHYLFAAAIFVAVTFLFTVYVAPLGFMPFVIAHGCQYIVFLAAHGGSRKASLGVAGGLALLGICMVAGLAVWAALPAGGQLGVAALMSITAVHFWIDQFVWRMRDVSGRRGSSLGSAMC